MYELARYLQIHFSNQKNLTIGENSVTPPSHEKLKKMAWEKNRRNSLRRIIRRIIRRAELEQKFVVFNGIADAVPEQKKLAQHVQHILRQRE